jgi:hypothetical protein
MAGLKEYLTHVKTHDENVKSFNTCLHDKEFDKSASYLDILFNIDSNGRMTTTPYDKRDEFDFAIVNFPFLCSNISLSLTYGVHVYISQLIRYARV